MRLFSKDKGPHPDAIHIPARLPNGRTIAAPLVQTDHRDPVTGMRVWEIHVPPRHNDGKPCC